MAKDVSKKDKPVKQGDSGKKPNALKRAAKSTARYFKDFKIEAKKIIYPSFSSVMKSTGVVLAFVFVMGVGVWGVDFGLSKLLELIKSFA